MKRFNSTKHMLRLEALEDRRVMSAYFELLEPFGGPDSAGYALGSSGPIVGSADVNAKNYHAALWMPGMGPDFELGTLGGPNSIALNINSRGTVVGWSNYTSDVNRRMAFKWSAESGMESLGFEGVAYGINASGDVVGQTSEGVAYVYEKGQLKLIPLSQASSQAKAINNNGMVVGYAESLWSSSNGHYIAASAFAWDDGALTDLGTLEGTNRSEAYAVNANGQVVGRSGSHICDGRGCVWMSSNGFVWNAESGMTDIGSLGSADDTAAYDINDSGRVVGSSNGHAFVYTQGYMFDLNDMVRDTGWTMTVATGINEQGWITGQATRACQTRAFLLIPDQVVIDPGFGRPGSLPADPNGVSGAPLGFGGSSKGQLDSGHNSVGGSAVDFVGDHGNSAPANPKPVCGIGINPFERHLTKIPLGYTPVAGSSLDLDEPAYKLPAELKPNPVDGSSIEKKETLPVDLRPRQNVRPLHRRQDDLAGLPYHHDAGIDIELP